MSSARRRANKRDDNEPEIRKRFSVHGWHTETLSASGWPDLLAYPPRPSLLGFTQVKHVDVKGAKGKPTPVQADRWTELAAAGIPVYVCRTPADVDALVAGTLDAWEPETRDVDAFARRLSSGAKLRSQPRTGSTAERLDVSVTSHAVEDEVMKRVIAKLAREEEARIRSVRATAALKRRGE